MGKRAGILHGAAESFGGVVRNADTDKHDGEGAAALDRASRAFCAISLANAVMRQAAGGEQRQLLPAHQAIHQIDGGEAGLDEIAGQFALGRIERHSVDPQTFIAGDRRAAIGRLADTVEDAAQQAGPDRKVQRLAQETAPARRSSPKPTVDSRTSTTIVSSSSAATRPSLGRPVRPEHLNRLIETGLDVAPQKQQRTFDGGGRA